MLRKDAAERPVAMDDVLRALKPVQSQLQNSEREPSDLDSDFDRRDSVPPTFSGDFEDGCGALHDTSDHGAVGDDESADAGEFEHKPPSDVYTVAEEGRIIYCDDNNAI